MKHFFLPLMPLRSSATGKHIFLGPLQFIFFLVCAPAWLCVWVSCVSLLKSSDVLIILKGTY